MSKTLTTRNSITYNHLSQAVLAGLPRLYLVEDLVPVLRSCPLYFCVAVTISKTRHFVVGQCLQSPDLASKIEQRSLVHGRATQLFVSG